MLGEGWPGEKESYIFGKVPRYSELYLESQHLRGGRRSASLFQKTKHTHTHSYPPTPKDILILNTTLPESYIWSWS